MLTASTHTFLVSKASLVSSSRSLHQRYCASLHTRPRAPRRSWRLLLPSIPHNSMAWHQWLHAKWKITIGATTKQVEGHHHIRMWLPPFQPPVKVSKMYFVRLAPFGHSGLVCPTLFFLNEDHLCPSKRGAIGTPSLVCADGCSIQKRKHDNGWAI